MSLMKNWSILSFAIAAALLFANASFDNDRVSAADAPSIALQHTASIADQTQPAGEQPNDSQRIDVQVWTLMAAGGAAALGLVLLGLRITLGWVKPPPEQEDAHH